uniref:O-fucosyltransferase family protein n=1 Tax=Ditylum brightwellii TaxID=49249 RepID=A0A7S4T301_9STRA
MGPSLTQRRGVVQRPKPTKGNIARKVNIFLCVASILCATVIWTSVNKILIGEEIKIQANTGDVGSGISNGISGSELLKEQLNSNTNKDEIKISDNSDGDSNDDNDKEEHKLPKWISDYMQWHREIRAKYPGKALLEDPSAPKVLVRMCLGLCGGLHDRLGQLPMDLYIANQTQRILLIKWIKPHPLEVFLVPPPTGLDWRFPEGMPGWGTNCKTLNECAKQVRNQPSIKRVNGGDRAEVESFDIYLSEQIHNLNGGSLSDTRIVTFDTLHVYKENDDMDKRLADLGETDMLYGTPSFGLIFRSFFQPHPDVQKLIDGVYDELGLVPGQYDAVHCRVRHPKAYPQGAKLKTSDGQEIYMSNADKIGLPFEGDLRDVLVETAVHAVQCAVTLPGVGGNPIYFMSDSNDLVDYITHDIYDDKFKMENAMLFENKESVHSKAAALASSMKLVAREQSIPNAHIDKNKGRKEHEYYGTFVDLYLGINAKCVAHGIGNFATFAARISGTSCVTKHTTEKWGIMTRFDASNTCPLAEPLGDTVKL